MFKKKEEQIKQVAEPKAKPADGKLFKGKSNKITW